MRLQLISGSVIGSLAKGLFVSGNVCGNAAENLRKFEKSFHCVRKECGNSAESLQKIRGDLPTTFCNDPFLNDPISELLSLWMCVCTGWQYLGNSTKGTRNWSTSSCETVWQASLIALKSLLPNCAPKPTRIRERQTGSCRERESV